MSIKELIKNTLSNFSKSLSKVFIKKSDVINNLTSSDTDKPQAAYQGKVLKDNINTLNSNLDYVKNTNASAYNTIEGRYFDSNGYNIINNNHDVSYFKAIPNAKYELKTNGKFNGGMIVAIKTSDNSVVSVIPTSESDFNNIVFTLPSNADGFKVVYEKNSTTLSTTTLNMLSIATVVDRLNSNKTEIKVASCINTTTDEYGVCDFSTDKKVISAYLAGGFIAIPYVSEDGHAWKFKVLSAVTMQAAANISIQLWFRYYD